MSEAASSASYPHIPVLLNQVVEYLALGEGDRLLDCTCGAGGHAQALLDRGVTVWGVDRDPRARALVEKRLNSYGDKFRILAGTFATIAKQLHQEGHLFNGILADLGVSSMQLDEDERGFGIRSEADADMRMGDEALTDALSFIDATPLEELADIIREYGEERMAGRVARILKEARAEGKRSAADLAAAVRSVIPGRQGRHPALRTFQALRIAVNGELDQLQELLGQLPNLLALNGRAVFISFHSLEDRLVKNSFRDLRREGVYATASKKVITADTSELADNRRAASAKLRWAQRSSQPYHQGLGNRGEYV